MARIKKKGTSGAAKAYLTRTQAVKKLQISLANFRRLCIFKGIYPREPRNRKKVSKSATHSTVFYYARDIQYLLHEPVLQKFRDHKIFAKKLKRAIGRGDFSDAKRLEDNYVPKITLDHIIKERYPTFNDALRDLDDALSMLHTFVNLPSSNGIPSSTISECDRLCNEWKHYIIRTRSLRKSFLSIKGIYFQAEINGQDILWLVPYKFAQNAPLDVDYRIMRTFVDFYKVLLGFVLFRLYTMEGLVYPPKFDQDADANGAALRAFSLESKGVQISEGASQRLEKDTTKQLKTLETRIASIADTERAVQKDEAEIEVEVSASDRLLDTFVPIESTAGTVDHLPQPVNTHLVSEDSTDVDPTNLFAPFTFFLSRETPREPLEFLLRAFGCKRIGWDVTQGEGSFTDNDRDPSITHQIVDRPVQLYQTVNGTQATGTVGYSRVPGRIYVQPQYVWDCVNNGKLQRPDGYAPGVILPPHLSPWIKPGNGYDPTAPLPDDGASSDSEVENINEDDAGSTRKTAPSDVDVDRHLGDNGMIVDMTDSTDDEDEDNDDDDDEDDVSGKLTAASHDESSDSEVESVDDEELLRQQHQSELEAEARGIPLPAPGSKKKKNTNSQSQESREAQVANEMRKILMPRRKRKLYEKMVYGNKRRADEVKDLQEKRRKIEKKAQKSKPKP